VLRRTIGLIITLILLLYAFELGFIFDFVNREYELDFRNSDNHIAINNTLTYMATICRKPKCTLDDYASVYYVNIDGEAVSDDVVLGKHCKLQEDTKNYYIQLLNNLSNSPAEARALERYAAKVSISCASLRYIILSKFVPGAPPANYAHFWRYKTIYYRYAPGLPDRYKSVFFDAASVWNNSGAGIRFLPATGSDGGEYFDVTFGDSCEASLGNMLPDERSRLYIADNCLTAGHIEHELKHILGFMHEQQRLDIGDYLYLPDNATLKTACRGGNSEDIQKCMQLMSFDRDYSMIQAKPNNTPYDPCSIMHYDISKPYNGEYIHLKEAGETAHKNCLNTMQKDLPDECRKIGQRCQPSPLDIQSVREAYASKPLDRFDRTSPS